MQVNDHQIRLLPIQDLERFKAILAENYTVSGTLEFELAELTHMLVVVYKEDFWQNTLLGALTTVSQSFYSNPFHPNNRQPLCHPRGQRGNVTCKCFINRMIKI